MSDSDEFSIHCESASVATLRGVLRLQSTDGYDRLFEGIRAKLRAATAPYTIDLREVLLMNSSGIRARAGLVLLAKEGGKALTLLVRNEIPWQKKTVVSLRMLYEALDVRAD